MFGVAARVERRIARRIVDHANIARDAGRFHDAALLYAQALDVQPENAAIHVQAGHMFKESGAPQEAERHYLRARELNPNDPDLALQLGHFYKGTGRTAEAKASYERAVALAPNWSAPATELRSLSEAGFGTGGLPQPTEALSADLPGLTQFAEALSRSDQDRDLAPALAPQARNDRLRSNRKGLELKHLGRDERTEWGRITTLRGVEAVRGFCISDVPVAEIRILLNGVLLQRQHPTTASMLPYEGDDPTLRKYCFNVWYDFAGWLPGRYRFEIQAIDVADRRYDVGRDIVIASPLAEVDHPTCDALIDSVAGAPEPLEARIAARPSVVRSSRRALLPASPKTILVQRPDQLGDLVVSLPALRRLRALFPEAKLVGLLSGANAAFGTTLGIFDEIVPIDFPEDAWERRRTMPLDRQRALKAELARHHFDMAIDLSENVWSRELLLLSGADFLVGFRSGTVALDVEIEGFTHDRMNNHEVVPHTNKLLGLVEWLAAMLRSEPNVVPRTDLERDRLATFGLLPDDRFVVLHDGARLQFSRWPHYPALAQALLDTTDLHVVLLTDDRAARAGLPSALADHPRFHLVDERLAFDDFDALVSFCAAFVGNDSGPKHLASFRGARVVSLHTARNNWNEWGQENGGLIISRKVPCAGCLIHHDPEECGKGFVCIRDISVDEVLRAVLSLL